ncbi:hypothetical protein B0F90DRAFT_1624661 [Multifurca ochricompacta]|uniref:DUF7727 domain-containing protein n=1 Tax=Multifurca ochricompacta TaxID=376703 RepID=A0AAD4M8G3_9AGAM|nr:hypothetical protein B0F90DRAFT_1624661 [Multifurca ochricompacta]
MGKLIWHEYSRYVSITASVYTVWAGYFGLLYRKFFWDFVNGIRRNPGGIQPAKQDAFFINIMVKAPVIQTISIILGLVILALEYPAPFMKGTAVHRSLITRVMLLVFQVFFAILFYQGTNGAIWSLVAIFGYTRAIMIGEVMKDAKDNKSKRERA